ncbi:MAG: GNAT family N-acetyltransferase [Prevotella sp.]
MFEIRRYTPDEASAWNVFVEQSKSGTFLFDRRYMDYHADRFADASLMIYRDGSLYALLPANVTGNVLYSHAGLTYGGLVTGAEATAAATVELFGELNAMLRSEGIESVVYKAVPWIYHRIPAEEDLYAIFRSCDARLISRNISSSMSAESRLRWSHGRRYGISKARNNGITVEESDDLRGFWKILSDNLENRYGARPVHTVDEMELLKSRFPRHIRLYVARREGEMLAGTVIYDTGRVVHTQYISASPEGKRLCALDAIFDRVLNHDFAAAPYFDFGKSTEADGRLLNETLIFQKEGFGGRGVCYDTYQWDLK